jgi:enoyl-CoA hydratase/carnithine racemase
VVPAGQLLDRVLDMARQIASLPAFATAATKRRILVEREAVWAPLFAEEERALREALLGL